MEQPVQDPVGSVANKGAARERLPFAVVRWSIALPVAVTILVTYFYVHQYNYVRLVIRHEHWIDLTTRWDELVPLVPAAYWPYSLFFLMIFAPVLLADDRRKLAQVVTAYLLVNVVGVMSWIAFPTRFVAPAVTCSGLTCDLVRALHENDAGINIFPSLHAAESVLAAAIFWTWRNAATPWVTLLAIAITCSTVLVKNHYVVDVPPGVVLGLVSWPISRWFVDRVWPARPANEA